MSDLAEEIYAATGLTLAGPAVAGIGKILEARDARIAELQAALQKKGCARDQKTTQYCSEVISRDARIAALEKALKRWIEADDGGDGHECIHALSDARKLVEGKKDE